MIKLRSKFKLISRFLSAWGRATAKMGSVVILLLGMEGFILFRFLIKLLIRVKVSKQLTVPYTYGTNFLFYFYDLQKVI